VLPGKRRKHVPLRSCIACRAQHPKRELIRVVRTPKGTLEIDAKGKRPGRGAYLCRDRKCWEAALQQGRLSHALKCEVSAEEVAALRAVVWSLFEEPAASSEALPAHDVSAEG
jgi:hypothetical protein